MTDDLAEGTDPELERKAAAPRFSFPLSFVIIDHPGSGAPDRATLEQYATVFNKVIPGDFAPEYQKTATVRVDTTFSPGEMPAGLFGSLDEPGALGYHTRGFIKVSPLLDAKDGAPLSATILHELLEALEDLTTDDCIEGADGKIWANEPADAVENDVYMVDGVACTNFVTRAWYSGVGTKYDKLGKLTRPRTLTPGGYAQWLDPTKGWQQVVHAELEPRSYRKLPHGRSHQRRHRWAARHTGV